jgi:DNA-binding response OmpR family regulator
MPLQLDGPILVVEFDRQLGNAITDQLVADGFSVELARTAEHARVLAAAHAPRLAVLGWLEPPRGALALLEEIRHCGEPHAPWDRALPTIVMGPQAHELDLLRAFEAGADDFLARPATYLELRGSISSARRPRISSRGAKYRPSRTAFTEGGRFAGARKQAGKLGKILRRRPARSERREAVQALRRWTAMKVARGRKLGRCCRC